MCGLIAMKTIEKAGFVTFEKDELKQMMILNSLRGIHSTGLAGFASNKKSEVSIVKATGSPYNLYNYPDTDKFFSRMVATFDTVIGHGRFATKGDINAINAHPFKEEHIVLAHNGTISNFFQLRDYKRHKDIEVDSHLIAKLFEEEGADAILPRVEGAYVFLWIDKKDNTLNVARNSQRPLYMAKSRARDTLMFASEGETLQWNASRNNTDVISITEVRELTHLKFHPDNLTPEVFAYKPIAKPFVSLPAKREESFNRSEHKSAPLSTIVTPLDELIRDSVTEDVSIQLGQEIDFIIDDYEFQQHHVNVTGFSEAYPDIMFRAVFPLPVKENLLLESILVRGVTSAIYPYYPRGAEESARHMTFSVFLQESRLIFDGDDEEVDDLVPITNFFSAEVIRYSKHRLSELADKGCAWCESFIPKRSLNKPASLLISDFEGQEQLICAKCVDGYNKATPH
jgi:predicted glutamine amidotransferase